MWERAGCGCGLAGDARGWWGRGLDRTALSLKPSGTRPLSPNRSFQLRAPETIGLGSRVARALFLICLPARGIGASGGRYA
jgi:hypothetical protein